MGENYDLHMNRDFFPLDAGKMGAMRGGTSRPFLYNPRLLYDVLLGAPRLLNEYKSKSAKSIPGCGLFIKAPLT